MVRTVSALLLWYNLEGRTRGRINSSFLTQCWVPAAGNSWECWRAGKRWVPSAQWHYLTAKKNPEVTVVCSRDCWKHNGFTIVDGFTVDGLKKRKPAGTVSQNDSWGWQFPALTRNLRTIDLSSQEVFGSEGTMLLPCLCGLGMQVLPEQHGNESHGSRAASTWMFCSTFAPNRRAFYFLFWYLRNILYLSTFQVFPALLHSVPNLFWSNLFWNSTIQLCS